MIKTKSNIEAENLLNISEMLKAIAHPMRIAILDLLNEGRMLSVTEIHNHLKIEQSSTSHHLGILKNRGVLFSKRIGKNTYYFLKHKQFTSILECLNKCAE